MKVSELNLGILSPIGIYLIQHIDSKKLYVGSALNLRKRWNRHLFLLNRGDHDNIHLQRSWNKYGPTAFQFSVIEYLEDESTLIAREQHWIDQLDAARTGYNLAPIAGSRRGTKQSEETKLKISKSGKGRVVSEETRKRMSIAFTGRVMSPEARAKLSVFQKNRSRESREKHAESLRQYYRNLKVAKEQTVQPIEGFLS